MFFFIKVRIPQLILLLGIIVLYLFNWMDFVEKGTNKNYINQLTIAPALS